jgi:NTE family protein
MRLNKYLISAVLAALLLLPFVPSPSFSIDQEEFITNYLWQKVISLSPPERPRIALVLGGGGARGIAHIGVLKVLNEEKLPVDIIVGNSVGALVGALYAGGQPMDKIEKLGENVGWNDLTDYSDPSILRLIISRRLLSTEKMELYLKKSMGNARFEDLRIPFACVATDLRTGERIILREGEVAPAARASATVPGLFDPVEYRHRLLVDGGLSDNIPIDVAKLLGADFIIAVPVSGDISVHDVSNVFKVLMQAIYIQGRQLDIDKLKEADFVIAPDVKEVTVADLSKSKECIESGMVAARQGVAGLKRKLIERTSDYYLFK